MASEFQEAMDPLYSEDEGEEEWMPFVGSAPDLVRVV